MESVVCVCVCVQVDNPPNSWGLKSPSTHVLSVYVCLYEGWKEQKWIDGNQGDKKAGEVKTGGLKWKGEW